MKKKGTNSPLRTSAVHPKLSLRGARIPSIGSNVVLVRIRNPSGHFKLMTVDRAGRILPLVGRALSQPGLRKSVVFPPRSAASLAAYYADPNDPSRIVKETATGRRQVGRIVGGKFKAG